MMKLFPARVLGVALAMIAAAPAASRGPVVARADREAAIDPVAVRAAAVRLADWQLQRPGAGDIAAATGETRDPRAWEQAVFWIGMTALADAPDAPPRIASAIRTMGARNAWTPGHRAYFADDHAIAQAYLWAAAHGAGAPARAPTRAVFDRVIASPAVTTLAFVVPRAGGYAATPCLDRWCWCDALFMAPPALAAMSEQTGDPAYRRFAMKEFWATTDFLFDPVDRLYYRDSRFFDRRDDRDRKQFWARGNGWVFGGMARIIPLLPKGSPDRMRMEALFKAMAARIASLQKPDGYWSPSLLAPENAPPETSGTGLFTFGFAWGIRAGLLNRATYRPVAVRGWQALARAVQPDGRLGWVQQVSDRPDAVHAHDTQYYGVGAFLLAATAIAGIDATPISSP